MQITGIDHSGTLRLFSPIEIDLIVVTEVMMNSDTLKKYVQEILDESAEAEDQQEKHEKYLRALLHVIAGIVAALTIIIAASIQSIGSSTATAGNSAKLYTLIFSEMTVYLSAVLFLATVAAFLVQMFRLIIKLFNKKQNNWPYWACSSSATIIVILSILCPSLVATNLAVCGAAALSTPASKWNAEGAKEKIADLLPGWLPARCDRNVKRWFQNPG